MTVKSSAVKGLTGLLEAILQLSRELNAGSFLWYRGHPCSSYKLLPGLLRDGRPAGEIFEREKRLLTRFRQRSLPFWPAGYPQNDWEHLFAMQHYGVPTRLLDWSENLFVSVHFALLGHVGDSAPIIWCIDPVSWNRAAPVLSEYGNHIQVLTTSDDESEAYRPETLRRRAKTPVAIFGTHNSVRIVAQRGTFMVWGEDLRPMDEFSTGEVECLWRFELLGDKAELRAQLNTLGFGETMVFPDLSSLATELARVESWK